MSVTRRTFAPHTSSVPEARRFVVQTLLGWQLPAAADAAELLVSELCTNAVLHARTAFTVEVSRGDLGEGDAVRVRVIDASTARARLRANDADSTTGRGVRLVDTLSSSWGVERLDSVDGGGPGKAVFFDLPVDGGTGRSFLPWDADGDPAVVLARFGEQDAVQEQPLEPPRDCAPALRTAA